MSSADIADPALNEAAEVLQQQIIYNGEVLDIAFESLRSYKPGTQSLAYLDSSVHLAYALMRMLEGWGKAKGGDMYVRKNKKKKAQGNGKGWSSLGVFSLTPLRRTLCCLTDGNATQALEKGTRYKMLKKMLRKRISSMKQCSHLRRLKW